MTELYTGSHPTVDPAQIIDGTGRLNASWQLRYAVVVNVLSDIQAVGRYDGDVTKIVPLISLVGTLGIGWRVPVVFIPPSGNYVISASGGGVPGASAVTRFASSDTIDTTVSGAYTSAGATLVAVDFIAPSSGRVAIYWGGELSNTLSSFTLVSPQVATGSVLDAGTPVLVADDARTARTDTINVIRVSSFHLLEDLNAGAPYNCTLYHRRGGAGTGGIARRRVLVVPTP